MVGTIFRYSLSGPFPVTNANATPVFAGTGRPTSQVVLAPAVSRYLYWGVNNSLRRIRADGSSTAETVLTAPKIGAGEVIEGVAVDSAGGKVYIATRPTGAVTAGYIRQVNLWNGVPIACFNENYDALNTAPLDGQNGWTGGMANLNVVAPGNGGAGKDQVKHMIGVLLSLPAEPPSDHAADALAAAVCHAAHAAGDRSAEVVPAG